MERISIAPRVYASLMLLVMASGSCSEAAFVDEVTVANPTDYTAHVSISGEADDGWILLTTVHAGGDTTVEQVIDQGSRWTFRFRYSGHTEEVEVPRADLESAGWRVEVPASFDDALRSRGVVPPP